VATQFQNRLIGTVILVSLGVIFLPDLLMGKKNDISAPPGSLPLRPEHTMTASPDAAETNNNVVAVVTSSAAVSSSSSSVSVNDSSSVAVSSSDNSWQVDEVAPTVTIGQPGSSTKTVVAEKPTATKQVQIANAKVENNISKSSKPQEIVRETKPAEVAKITETAKVEPVTTIQTRKDDSGLTIKTPAQVEAERAARQQQITTKSTTSVKPINTIEPAAHNGSWIVQVGVFSNAENAKSLVSRLRSAGYSASTMRAGSLTRVIVGPDVSKDKLQRQLSGINSATGTNGRIIPYSAVAN